MKNAITGKTSERRSRRKSGFQASVCAGVFSALPLTAKMEDVFTLGVGCMTLVRIIHFAVFDGGALVERTPTLHLAEMPRCSINKT